jgi:threonine/homoserine efflux transporter RhtA
MFDFFLFNHVAMLGKDFGFGVSVHHINLLFYKAVTKMPQSFN